MRVEEELRTYLQVLWRYKWMVAACAIVAALVALGVSTQLTPIYAASATVRVASAPGGEADYIYISTLPRLSNTYVEIANSEISLNEVAKRLGLQEKPKVQVEVVPDTELIRINASDPDPSRARDIANTLADLMMERSTQFYGGNAPTAREILEGQLQQAKTDLDAAVSEYEDALRANQTSSLPDDSTPVTSPEVETLSHILYVRQQIYTDLLQKYESARTSEQLHANAITIIESAGLPEKPATPNIPINTVLGLIAGLAVGVILTFLFEGMDDTVHSIEDVEALTTLPIFCEVPELRSRMSSTGNLNFYQNGHLSLLPSFHQLRTRLILNSNKPKSTSFLITSPEPGTGKSTVSVNLAMSLAESGSQVILLDMNFHRPHLHSILHLPNELGLSNLLRNEIQLEAVLQDTPYPNLRVITAGSSTEEPSEWLTPFGIGALLKQLHKDGSYVVIDAPAFLSVAEPTVIASQVDAVIVVVARRSTQRQHLHLTLQQLAELKCRISGLVVNRMPRSNMYEYYAEPRRPHLPLRWGKSTQQVVEVQSGTSGLNKE